MVARKNHKIYTLQGDILLNRFAYSLSRNQPVVFDTGLRKSAQDVKPNALMDQLQMQMQQQNMDTSMDQCLFFVDFEPVFSGRKGRFGLRQKELFHKILTDGFDMQMDGSAEGIRYVPFEKSNSQAKACVISFLRQDLFLPMRRRLDLNIWFQDCCDQKTFLGDISDENRMQCKGFPNLSKLYAYRGLYLSDGIRIDPFGAFLNPRQIIVLNDYQYTPRNRKLKTLSADLSCSVYTQDHCLRLTKDDLILKEEPEEISTIFDGSGLISPRAAACINKVLYPEKCADLNCDADRPDHAILEDMKKLDLDFSFQFRLPFCKGVLHTVDFHGFLEEYNGDKTIIRDYFGIDRDLRDVQVILNKSVMKLISLLGIPMGTDTPITPDPMADYCAMLKAYDHGLYITQTERRFTTRGFEEMNYQFLNTLNISDEDMHALISRHIDRVRELRTANILLKEGNVEGVRNHPKEKWAQYIQENYRLVLDYHVEGILDGFRRQKLDALCRGHIEVAGESRYLSRDLLYFLYKLAVAANRETKPLKKCLEKCLWFGQVCLPGTAMDAQTLALFRSPHLSSNENVLAQFTAGSALHEKYCGHLTKLAMVSYSSYMPDALGGADFDGDFVYIISEKIIVDACKNNSFCETDPDSLPVVKIPALPSDKQIPVHEPGKLRYVDVATIYNTFNSLVGQISNAALKIKAAETADPQVALPVSSQLCTILTGLEIDAAKNGRHPDLTETRAFSNHPKRFLGSEKNKQTLAAVEATARYLDNLKELEAANAALLQVQLPKDEEKKKEDTAKIKVWEGFHNGRKVCFLSDADSVSPLGRMLIAWAEARAELGATEPNYTEAADKMHQWLVQSQNAVTVRDGEMPRKDVLTALVTDGKPSGSAVVAQITREILKAYDAANRVMTDIQIRDCRQKADACMEKAVFTLKMQYDDIDRQTDSWTLREQLNVLRDQLYEQLGTEQKVEAAIGYLFTNGDLDNFWPYLSKDNREEKLSRKNLPLGWQILTNFRSRGYNILFFLLKAVQYQRHVDDGIRNLEQTPGKEPYARYCRLIAQGLREGRSITYIQTKMVGKACRQDLLEAASAHGVSSIGQLFCTMYPPEKKHADLLWKIFQWDEIRANLGGADYAQ